MARLKECPRYNVISFRVSDEEILFLRHLRRQRKTSVSALMREAVATLDALPDKTVEDKVA